MTTRCGGHSSNIWKKSPKTSQWGDNCVDNNRPYKVNKILMWCDQWLNRITILCSYTVLHCTTLHCTALHCTALHYTAALHCTGVKDIVKHKICTLLFLLANFKLHMWSYVYMNKRHCNYLFLEIYKTIKDVYEWYILLDTFSQIWLF